MYLFFNNLKLFCDQAGSGYDMTRFPVLDGHMHPVDPDDLPLHFVILNILTYMEITFPIIGGKNVFENIPRRNGKGYSKSQQKRTDDQDNVGSEQRGFNPGLLQGCNGNNDHNHIKCGFPKSRSRRNLKGAQRSFYKISYQVRSEERRVG